MFGYMSFNINNMLQRLHMYIYVTTIKSTLHNKESHSNLDTKNIICYYKYEFVYIVRK